jgi:hypothetical protein
MRNSQCRTCNLTRKLKNLEKEIKTLFDLEYCGKTEKHGK